MWVEFLDPFTEGIQSQDFDNLLGFPSAVDPFPLRDQIWLSAFYLIDLCFVANLLKDHFLECNL